MLYEHTDSAWNCCARQCTNPDNLALLQLISSCKPPNFPHNLVSKKQKLLEKLLRTPAPKLLKAYQVKDAKEALERAGVTGERE